MIDLEEVKKDHEKIIKDLEDELIRKQKLIDELKEQNKILLKTALKGQEKLSKKKELFEKL